MPASRTTPARSRATPFGSDVSRRRQSAPSAGPSSAMASTFANPTRMNAPTTSVFEPEIGWSVSSTASATVSTANVGHSQAPRIRQRRRLAAARIGAMPGA